MRTGAAIARHPDWRQALAELTGQLPLLSEEDEAHLALLFANSEHRLEFPDLVSKAGDLTGAHFLVGCSGQGVIGTDREIEGEPAVALLVFSLPRAELTAVHLTQEDLELCHTPEDWHRLTGVAPGASAWLLFVDPFTLDAEALVKVLSTAYPGTPLVGGLASGDPRLRGTHLFLNGEVYDRGAVALALGGPYRSHHRLRGRRSHRRDLDHHRRPGQCHRDYRPAAGLPGAGGYSVGPVAREAAASPGKPPGGSGDGRASH